MARRRTYNDINEGEKYGKFTIKEFFYHIKPSGGRIRKVTAVCVCGTVVTQPLKTFAKRSDCGCIKIAELVKKKELKLLQQEERRRERELKKNLPRKEQYKYVPGYKHHDLTIISRDGSRNKNGTVTVKCECGTIKTIKIDSIYAIMSCGCRRPRVHGNVARDRKWYDRWRAMVKRCTDPKSNSYKNYGARGITVCERWMLPEGEGCKNFYDDIHQHLGAQPGPDYSLDRIDNDGIYEITNLKWSTRTEQNSNRRSPNN